MQSFISNKKGDEYKIMGLLVMLIGVSGCGKSSFARDFSEGYDDTEVFSSDAIRKEVFGDENDQTHNNEVFSILHKRIISSLKKGKVCIYDATNLNRKRRMTFLHSISDIPCEKFCAVFATPFEVCIERDRKRERSVGAEVIRRQISQFQLPIKEEGWDGIKFLYEKDKSIYKNLLDYIPKEEVPHDCSPWHVESIQSHLRRVLIEACKERADWTMSLAARYHDIGKFYTKSFWNSKTKTNGEKAHYYGHENWSAYLVLSSYDCATAGELTGAYFYAVELIALHMELYKKNSSILEVLPKDEVEDLKLLKKYDILGSVRGEI